MTTSASSTSRIIAFGDVGSVELTMEAHGSGRPLLLLHGGAGPQSVAGFAQLLAADGNCRVLAPTHPGFGGTPRPEFMNSIATLASLYQMLLEDLDVEGATVIGNSVGGWIGAELALRGTPRVERLVLIDAVGVEVAGHPVADVSGLSLPEIQALSFHDPAPFRVDPAAMPEAQRAIVTSNGEALAAYTKTPEMADPGLRQRLADIAIPTLVLWGESDRIVDVEYGRAYAGAIPGARFAVLPSTGHMPQLETPALVVDAVRKALEGEGAGRSA